MTVSKARLKELRITFRNETLKRDGYKCVICLKPAVDAHHITSRKEIHNDGYVKENGISLCAVCHIFAELYFSSCKAYWLKGFDPEALYTKIRSSKEEAFKKALALK